jgi:hypothetical protein
LPVLGLVPEVDRWGCIQCVGPSALVHGGRRFLALG